MKWDINGGVVRGFAWNTILHAPDPVETLNCTVGEVIHRFVPTVVVLSIARDKVWFDGNGRRAITPSKQISYWA